MSDIDRTTQRIGADEWVAQVEHRREERRGVGGVLLQVWERLPAAARLALIVLPALVFPLVANSGDVYRYGIITILYALLALGLNTVVGFAGLLDLGYMAFFGFGAYAFGFLASDHSGHHVRTEIAIPLVVVMTALLGLLLGLPSRRLIGDYLAIVTLFFGQAFVVFVNNADRIDFPHFGQVDLTGGPNGLTDIDNLSFFGVEITTTNEYYYVSLIAFVLVMVMLHFVSESRTGRAWRALREDPLAAEAMSIPVNRLKLLAFAFGAAVAGFTGTIYGSVQTGAFPGDFDVALLITIYAIVILGGAGSLTGIVVAAIIVQGVPELLRTPETARWLFYGAILLGLVARLRPWPRLVGVLVALVGFGFALHALADEFWPRWTAREIEDESALASFLEAWMLLPSDPKQLGNWAFVALIAAFLLIIQLGPFWRTIALVPVLYLAGFVWENLLIQEVAGATPLILLGALLIVLMNARPQGLFGTARVEIA